jgi:hypothetical protein
MSLGLDELMIVNPGRPRPDATWLLGDDGGLYRIDGVGEGTPPGLALGDHDVPRFFLGDDGTLYERT